MLAYWDENGVLLDGKTRWDACKEIGMSFNVKVVSGLSEAEKRQLIWSLNKARRHMTVDQMAKAIDCRFVSKHAHSGERESTCGLRLFVCSWSMRWASARVRPAAANSHLPFRCCHQYRF